MVEDKWSKTFPSHHTAYTDETSVLQVNTVKEHHTWRLYDAKMYYMYWILTISLCTPYPFLQEVVGEGNQTGRASKHSIRPEKFLVYGARWSDIELLLWMQPLTPSIVNGTQTLILTVGKGLLTFNVPTHCPDSIGVTRKFRDSHFRYLIEEIDHRSSEQWNSVSCL